MRVSAIHRGQFFIFALWVRSTKFTLWVRDFHCDSWGRLVKIVRSGETAGGWSGWSVGRFPRALAMRPRPKGRSGKAVAESMRRVGQQQPLPPTRKTGSNTSNLTTRRLRGGCRWRRPTHYTGHPVSRCRCCNRSEFWRRWMRATLPRDLCDLGHIRGGQFDGGGRTVAIPMLPARKIAQNTFARHPTLAAAFSLLHSVESGVLLLRLLLQKLLAVARLLLFSRKLLDFVVVVKVVVVVEHPTLHPTLMRVGCKVGCSTTTTTFTTTTKSNNFRENNNNLATANNFCNNNRNSNTPLSTECKRENAAAKVGCLAKVFCAIFRAGSGAIATVRPPPSN